MGEAQQKTTILWVDDDNHMLVPQKENLIDTGYRVRIEPDVDKVIDRLVTQNESFDGIILDVMMNPGTTLYHKNHRGGLLTGLVLLEYLNEKGVLNNHKVFMLSHRIDPEAVKRAERLEVTYHHKQDYKGKALCELVENEFGK